MRALFLSKQIGTDSKKPRYKEIMDLVSVLRDEGIEVFYDFIIADEFEPSEEKRKEFLKQFTQYKKQADVLVAEVSDPDAGVGQEIGFFLLERKPVLVLYKEDKEASVPTNILGIKSPYLTVLKYTEDKQAKIDAVREFAEIAKTKLDTKFILIISPEIDRYLQWAGDYKRMHKAQIVRNSVEKEMENDEDYQKYLKENN